MNSNIIWDSNLTTDFFNSLINYESKWIEARELELKRA